MTDRSRSGARCRTLHPLNTLKGMLPRDTYGVAVGLSLGGQ